MKDFLLQLAHASFQGGVIIAVIFALRFALKKAPKSILCLLWLLAITRLLLPIQLESSLSLQPDIAVITQQESQQPESLVQTPSQQVPAVPMETIQIGDGEIIHPIYSDSIITPEQPAVFDWASALPWIWLSVAAGLILWSILSYLRLRNRTKSAIVLDEGIWLSPELDSAFVLGYLKPQIYLPAKLNKQEQTLVISHERAHIRRFDHWYKLLGFITLCVHWFNPLVWLAYIFLCRDMEMACDEQVVRDMDTTQRKAYSMALLRCSADSHHFKHCPVAFAEVSVKDRIKGVLNYKKPGFWMTLVGIVAVVFVAVCFLTSPADTNHSDDPAPPQTEAEYRQHCIDLMKQLRASEYRYLTCTIISSNPDDRNQYIRQIEMPDFFFVERSMYENQSKESYYLDATIVTRDGNECYWRQILNPGDDWVKKSIDEIPGTAIIPEYLSCDLTAFETYPMNVCEFEKDLHCIFNVMDASNNAHTMEFRFDENGTLTAIVNQYSSIYGESTHRYEILWKTDEEIWTMAEKLRLEAQSVCQLRTLKEQLAATQAQYEQLTDSWLRKCIDIQTMLCNTVLDPANHPIHLQTDPFGACTNYDPNIPSNDSDTGRRNTLLQAYPMLYWKSTSGTAQSTWFEWYYFGYHNGSNWEYHAKAFDPNTYVKDTAKWLPTTVPEGISLSIQLLSPQKLLDAPFRISSDSEGTSCIFEAEFAAGPRILTYRFDLNGDLEYIETAQTGSAGDQHCTKWYILSTSADEIKGELEAIYSTVQKDNP